MQYEITDRAAIEFARAFYRALANGLPVDAAVTEARMAVSFGVENTIEWGTPVLYMRSSDGVLFNVQKKKAKGKKRVKEEPIASEKEDPSEEKEKKRDIELKMKETKEFEQMEQERREREERQAELSALYSKGTEALAAQDWQTAIKNFQDILNLDADNRDASDKLREAEQQLAKERERKAQENAERQKTKQKEKRLKKQREEQERIAGGKEKLKAGERKEEKSNYKKLLIVIGFLGVLLVGYWMISSDFQMKPTPSDFINSIEMEFMRISPGEFEMGSPSIEGYDDEGPTHHIMLTEAFYMGKYEVTQKQWREVMGYNPSYFKGDNLPVEQVSWNDVQKFIMKLNEKEGTTKYRLPTEAEWEYVARAGSTTKYSFGDDESMLGSYAWYHGNSGGKTHEVGKKKPNLWGLYDMSGNVWEWVQDVYHSSYNGAPTDGSAWEDGGSERVFRGGSWKDGARGCRSADRDKVYPDYRSSNLGFRLLRDL